MLAIKNKGGLLKLILAKRSNIGCYKTEAVSRPELYLPYFHFYIYCPQNTDILRAVNVETVSGRVYKVNKSEQDDATRLNKFKN